MRSRDLWAGELLLRRARPHPAAYAGRFAIGLTLLAAAAGLALLAAQPSWAAFEAHRFGAWVAAPALHGLSLVAFLVVGLLGARFVRRDSALALALAGWGLGVAVAGGLWLANPVAGARDASLVVPGTLAMVGGAALLVVEAKRRRVTLTVTSRRLVLEEGLGRRRTRTMALEAVTGVDWAEPLLGRLLGYATLRLSSEVLRARRGTRRGRLAKATDDSLSETRWTVAGLPTRVLRRELDRVLLLAAEEDDVEERELVLKVLDTLPEVSRFATERPLAALGG